MGTIVLRTVIIYLLLLASIRLMGKRQVGELEISELVITFLLSELAVIPIADKTAPLWHAAVSILILLSAEIVTSYFASKCPAFRKLLIGKPSVIINKGTLDKKELSRQRISISELLSELRLQGIASLSEVQYAIIEDNGKLSVFTEGIAHCVIADGAVSPAGLSEVGRDEKWLRSYLKERNTAVEDVYVMTVDDGGKIFIIYNEEK